MLSLAEQWDQLTIVDGILHRRHEDANGRSHLQVVAPKVSRSDIMHHLHDGIAGGHLGEAKTLSRLRERSIGRGTLVMCVCGAKHMFSLCSTKESNPYTESTSSEHVSQVPHADSGSGHCRTISIG